MVGHVVEFGGGIATCGVAGTSDVGRRRQVDVAKCRAETLRPEGVVFGPTEPVDHEISNVGAGTGQETRIEPALTGISMDAMTDGLQRASIRRLSFLGGEFRKNLAIACVLEADVL